jgi:pimeloyl-ACP methyl ester carboxylesterase
MLENTYLALRQFIFANIYPAPAIFNRATRNFIGLQQFPRIVPDYQELGQRLSFDLDANMHLLSDHELMQTDHFEALLIAKLLDKNIYVKDKQYIILVGGNTTCYQIFIPEMLELHRRHYPKALVLAFNPPGVGLSYGATNSTEDYCAALASIIDNLFKNKVPAQNIMIVGHSLGAAVAARIVAKYNEDGQPIRLFADRTMMNISDIVATRIRAIIPTAILRYTIGAILYLLMKSLIRLLHLELDVARDFARINALNPGAARGMMVQEDEVIKDCDLGHALPKTQLEYFRCFKLRMEEKLRKAHSKPRQDLIDEDSKQNAEQYLDRYIQSNTLVFKQ